MPADSVSMKLVEKDEGESSSPWPSMLCTQIMTVREPDHHGGKDHGGGSKRNPVLGVLLLVACIYPFRCVVRTSVHSE